MNQTEFKLHSLRGCVTTIFFILALSGCSTALCLIAFLIVIILEPNTPTLLDLKWQTIVIIAIYFILSLKILVKLSRSLSNSICNFLFGKEEENDI